MTRNRIIAALAVLILLGGAWYYGSPRWTLHQMAAAAEARDGEKLASYIDFPPLRDSVKSQMKGQLAANMAGSSTAENGFAALGALFAMKMIDPMVDGLLTPEAMRAMFANAPPPGEKKPLGFSRADAGIDYDGVNQFRLIQKSAGKRDTSLVFRRHGLGWKLSDIRLPDDLMADKPA